MAELPFDLEPYTLDEIRNTRMSAESFRLSGLHALGPAWRWRKAEETAVRRHLPSCIDRDPCLLQIVGHFTELPAELRETLCDKDRLDIAAAEAIFWDPTKRLHTEARLLARMSPDEVSARTGETPQGIHDYCEVFFDVGDGLAAKDWLAVHVFDPAAEFSSELLAVVRQEAYQGGPEVCEHWLERLAYLEDECDLATTVGREVRRLQLILQQRRMLRDDAARLSELALKNGDLASCRNVRFASASDAIGQRTAQQLGELLSRDDDAPGVVQIQQDSHLSTCEQRHSA